MAHRRSDLSEYVTKSKLDPHFMFIGVRVIMSICSVWIDKDDSGRNLVTEGNLATRPSNHPISPYLSKAAKKQVKKHPTALHHLAKTSGINPDTFEKINATRLRPGTDPGISTLIADTKEESIEWDKANFKSGTRIYTDGSGYQDTIGAAAILFQDGIRTSELRYQLGPAKSFTVFEGELTGIILGLHLLRTRRPANLSIDNQATILTLRKNKPQSAQYLIDEIKKITLKIQKKALQNQEQGAQQRQQTTSLTWVAGHMNSEGNEAVDKLAKEAAEFGSSEQQLLPAFLRRQLPKGLSACLQQIAQLTKENNEKWWKQSRRYSRTKTIDPDLPAPSYIKATNGLNRRQISVLTQMRTGHNSLNKHLHRIKRADSPRCPHCPNAYEDATHVLFRCWKYATQRHQLALTLKRKAYSIQHLLSNRSAIRHTLNFLNKTGRFRATYGDISAELIDDNK